MTRNAVQLITYADRLAGDVPGLARLMASAAVVDRIRWRARAAVLHTVRWRRCRFRSRRPHPGGSSARVRGTTWRHLAVQGDLMIDIIVNHVSSSSAAFKDWCERGASSPYDGMFLTMSTVFPDGASEADLTRIYRPRPGLPFTPYRVAGNSVSCGPPSRPSRSTSMSPIPSRCATSTPSLTRWRRPEPPWCDSTPSATRSRLPAPRRS